MDVPQFNLGSGFTSGYYNTFSPKTLINGSKWNDSQSYTILLQICLEGNFLFPLCQMSLKGRFINNLFLKFFFNAFQFSVFRGRDSAIQKRVFFVQLLYDSHILIHHSASYHPSCQFLIECRTCGSMIAVVVSTSNLFSLVSWISCLSNYSFLYKSSLVGATGVFFLFFVTTILPFVR